MIDEAIERWATDDGIRTCHRRTVAADPATTWDAARSIRLDDTRTLGRLVRWRIPGTPPDITFYELFRSYPFTLLEEGDTWSLSGLCGKIWTVQRDYPRLRGPEDFAAWDRAGTVRVLLIHSAQALDGASTELVSDCRVMPVDTRAQVRLKALWTVIGGFERLIGAEPLAVAQRRAESA